MSLPVILSTARVAVGLVEEPSCDEPPSDRQAAAEAIRLAARDGRMQAGNAGMALPLVLAAMDEVRRVDAAARHAQAAMADAAMPPEVATLPDATSAYRHVADGHRAADGSITEVSRAKSVLAHLRYEAGRAGDAAVTAPTVAQAYVDEDGVDGVRHLRSEAGWEQYRSTQSDYLTQHSAAIRWAEGVLTADAAPAKVAAAQWVASIASMPMDARIAAAASLPREVKAALAGNRDLPKAVRRALA